MTPIRKYARLLLPFLNQDIRKLPTKAPAQMPVHVRKEITHYDEMNHKIIDINMNMWDNARNGMESISFHRFHGSSNSTIHMSIDGIIVH
jgi:hypothetical protein